MLDHHSWGLLSIGMQRDLTWHVTTLGAGLETEVLQVNSELAAPRFSSRVVKVLPGHLLLLAALRLANLLISSCYGRGCHCLMDLIYVVVDERLGVDLASRTCVASALCQLYPRVLYRSYRLIGCTWRLLLFNNCFGCC